jgi:hypothetical protein
LVTLHAVGGDPNFTTNAKHYYRRPRAALSGKHNHANKRDPTHLCVVIRPDNSKAAQNARNLFHFGGWVTRRIQLVPKAGPPA